MTGDLRARSIFDAWEQWIVVTESIMEPFFPPPPGILKAPQGALITKVAVKLEVAGTGKGDPQFVELDQKRPLAAVIQVRSIAILKAL